MILIPILFAVAALVTGLPDTPADAPVPVVEESGGGDGPALTVPPPSVPSPPPPETVPTTVPISDDECRAAAYPKPRECYHPGRFPAGVEGDVVIYADPDGEGYVLEDGTPFEVD